MDCRRINMQPWLKTTKSMKTFLWIRHESKLQHRCFHHSLPLIFIPLTLVSAHFPHLLNPSLNQSLPKSCHRGSSPPAPSLLLVYSPGKPRKQQHIQGSVSRESQMEWEGGEQRWDWMGKQEIEWREGEFLWKGANPITGSGASLVSLVSLHSHFNTVSHCFSSAAFLCHIMHSILLTPPCPLSLHLSISHGCRKKVMVWHYY